MADGSYVFRNCIPDGPFDIANVSPGDVLNRAWSFRCNAPVELQSQLDSGAFDPRNILRGTDGLLYDGDGNFLAQVNTWQCQLNPNTSDYQPAGQKQVWAILQGYTVQLTFTETVIRDGTLLAKVLAGFAEGARDVVLNFRGVLRGRNAA